VWARIYSSHPYKWISIATTAAAAAVKDDNYVIYMYMYETIDKFFFNQLFQTKKLKEINEWKKWRIDCQQHRMCIYVHILCIHMHTEIWMKENEWMNERMIVVISIEKKKDDVHN